MAKESIIDNLRQCPEAEIRSVLIGFIRGLRLPEEKTFNSRINYFNNVLLGQVEEQAMTLPEGDRENACRIAVRAWGRVQGNGYYIGISLACNSRKDMLSFLKWHEKYEGLEDEVERLRQEAEALSDGDIDGLSDIAGRMEKIFREYIFSFVTSEGIRERVDPEW